MGICEWFTAKGVGATGDVGQHSKQSGFFPSTTREAITDRWNVEAIQNELNNSVPAGYRAQLFTVPEDVDNYRRQHADSSDPALRMLGNHFLLNSLRDQLKAGPPTTRAFPGMTQCWVSFPQGIEASLNRKLLEIPPNIATTVTATLYDRVRLARFAIRHEADHCELSYDDFQHASSVRARWEARAEIRAALLERVDGIRAGSLNLSDEWLRKWRDARRANQREGLRLCAGGIELVLDLPVSQLQQLSDHPDFNTQRDKLVNELAQQLPESSGK